MPHPQGVRLFKKGWRLRPAGGREFGRMAPGAVYPMRLRLRLPEEGLCLTVKRETGGTQ